MTEDQSIRLFGLSYEDIDGLDSLKDLSIKHAKKNMNNIKELLQKQQQQQQYNDIDDSSSWDDLAYRDYQSRECSSLLFDIFQPSQGSSNFQSQLSSSTIIPSYQYLTPIKQKQQYSRYCQFEDSEDDYSSGGSATTNETHEEMQQSSQQQQQQQQIIDSKGRQKSQQQQKVKRVQLKEHIDMLWNAPFDDVKVNILAVGPFQQYP